MRGSCDCPLWFGSFDAADHDRRLAPVESRRIDAVKPQKRNLFRRDGQAVAAINLAVDEIRRFAGGPHVKIDAEFPQQHELFWRWRVAVPVLGRPVSVERDRREWINLFGPGREVCTTFALLSGCAFLVLATCSTSAPSQSCCSTPSRLPAVTSRCLRQLSVMSMMIQSALPLWGRRPRPMHWAYNARL